MAYIEVADLTFRYALNSQNSINGVSFSVQRGETLLICGASGSGKSTLLRLLKPELSPRGEMSGKVRIEGILPEMPDTAARIGFVGQRPEQQIVTDKVWHELSFTAEHTGMNQDTMRLRVAETAAFFGFEDIFEQDTATLSGGQKQLLTLASVMTAEPEILLLDEPTSQLDPISRANWHAMLTRLKNELGITIITVEHNPDDAITLCDKMLVLHEGSAVFFGSVNEAIRASIDNTMQSQRLRETLAHILPDVTRIAIAAAERDNYPLTVAQGRKWLTDKQLVAKATQYAEAKSIKNSNENSKIMLKCKNVYFRYSRQERDVLRDLNIEARAGEILCLLGGNGSGKTSALRVLSGIARPYTGKVQRSSDFCAVLPQDVQTLFTHDTVGAELRECGVELQGEWQELQHRHPYDLSGGQQQMLALAKVLASKPKILLLDEPTKGLDYEYREQLRRKLAELRNGVDCGNCEDDSSGVCIIIVTHDVEFAAQTADRCALLFRGSIQAQGDTRSFLASNRRITTTVCRLLPDSGAITYEDALTTLGIEKGDK